MPRRRRLERPYRPKFSVPDVDPRELRRSLGFSQRRFAAFLGVSVRVIEGWERPVWRRLKPGEVSKNNSRWEARFRQPTGAARTLLAMIQKDPWIVFDCLTEQISPDRG